MLYDADQGVRSRLLELRKWIAAKDPKESYNWHSQASCLFCQFSGRTWHNIDKEEFGGSGVMMFIGKGTILGSKDDWTFGKALKRVERVLERQYDVELA